MLAKGHDLPGLTLVVVAGVDEGLHSVDFRAGERLGQLIVQVAGRAGRADRPGAVILQTHQPDHPLLRDLIEGGYPALAGTLMRERRAAALPPFAHFALLRAEAKSIVDANTFLSQAVEVARRPCARNFRTWPTAGTDAPPSGLPAQSGAHRGGGAQRDAGISAGLAGVIAQSAERASRALVDRCRSG